MSGINVANGVGTINLLTTGEFVGSTCPEGTFPPTGYRYEQFVFSPKKGTNGLLIFRDTNLDDSYYFWPYFWKDGKLFVEYQHQYVPANPFIKSGEYRENNFGFMVQYRPDRVFVTRIPADLKDDVEYVLVDVMTMMKFINGKINRRQLARSAVERHKREVERVTLKDMLKAGASEYAWLQGQYDDLSRANTSLSGQNLELHTKVQSLQSLLKSIHQITFDLHSTWQNLIRAHLLRAVLGEELLRKLTNTVTLGK